MHAPYTRVPASRERRRAIARAAVSSERDEEPGRSAVPAAQTGTAEHGTDPKNTPPHAWYVAFAPADNPQIAVCVVDHVRPVVWLDSAVGLCVRHEGLVTRDLLVVHRAQSLAVLGTW